MRDPLQPEIAAVFSREDMGGMLDLKLETVSREISRLIHDGLIRPVDKSNRRYEILNIDRLSQVDYTQPFAITINRYFSSTYAAGSPSN